MGFKIAQSQSFAYHHDDQNNHDHDHDHDREKHFALLREAVITLRLGALVVHFSDDSDTRHRLQNSIKYHTAFSVVEKKRLHHYLLRRLNALENLQEVRAEVARLVLSKKRRVRHILLSLAFANSDHVTGKQHYSIEQLYLALGLNTRLLANDLATFFATDTHKKHFPVHQSTLELRALEKPVTDSTADQNEHTLSAIFAEEKKLSREKTATPSSEMVTATYGQQSLSDKRERLYKHLILQSQWTQQAFQRLCKHHKLVPNGAVEVLNNWSNQHVNAAVLLQSDDFLLVDMTVVEKLSSIPQ